MWTRAGHYKDILGGWKTYCAWGDVPYSSGWQLDSDYGMEFLANVRAISDAHPEIPPVVATHKGFALPGFDQRGAAPRDVGPAAKANPRVRFMIYHSGYDIFESGVPVGGQAEGPYPGDDKVDSSTRSVNAFIKSLRENDYDASRFVEPGKTFGNVPNVWAELGSVWREHISDPNAGAHLLGKLITHVGPKRIAWGTDSLWYGSPHREIIALRKLRSRTRRRSSTTCRTGSTAMSRTRHSRRPRPIGRSATESSAATRPRPTTSIPTSSGRGSSATTSTDCASRTTSRTPASSPKVLRCGRTRCTAGGRGATSSRISWMGRGRHEDRKAGRHHRCGGGAARAGELRPGRDLCVTRRSGRRVAVLQRDAGRPPRAARRDTITAGERGTARGGVEADDARRGRRSTRPRSWSTAACSPAPTSATCTR